MITKNFRCSSVSVRLICVCGCLLLCSVVLYAQLPAAQTCSGTQAQCDPTYGGDSVVWQPTSVVSELNTHDYVDASVFVNSSGTSPIDICAALVQALAQVGLASNQYNTKAVIDARGIYPRTAGGVSSPGNLACANSNDPWPPLIGAAPPYAVTVLLPAGIINISQTWQIPQNTQLIGEEPSSTTIQACTATSSNCPSGAFVTSTPDMIDMGVVGDNFVCPNHDCNGMAVEHLAINGNNISGLNGIVNTASQEQSYVNDVSFQKIAAGTGVGTGVGLKITGQNGGGGYAVNSGPYSNIYFSNGSGTCLSIQGTYGLRGIQGLTCKGSSGTTAVLLDGSNTSIQDVYISNYTNGIVIGSQSLGAQNNLLFDIAGGSSVTNLVEICAPLSTNTGAPCPQTLTSVPSDITLMGVSSTANNTIVDQVTGNTLQHSSTEPSVALYVVGEPISGTSTYPTQSSFFTTSRAFPTWYVGMTSPTGKTCQDSEVGSLFSFISPTGTDATLWLCVGTTWTVLQQ